MDTENDLLFKQAIANSFSAAADKYDQAAFIEQEIGSRLLERLAMIKIHPKRILDLGCGTGYLTHKLHLLFPDADIIGVDIAFGMVKFATNNKLKTTSINYYCADAEQLPFRDQSFDLVFSNCCLASLPNFSVAIQELQRVVKINGLLLFSTFGPDTLAALMEDIRFLDMHHIGDILIAKQFKSSVVDMEYIKISYSSMRELLTDLQNTGAYQLGDLATISSIDEPYTAIFEVVYGHAIGDQLTAKQFTDDVGNVYISAENIKCL